MDTMKIWTARLFALACLALGIIGLIVGFTDKTWQLGVVAWFTGGIFLGVVGLILILDGYTERERSY